ncbi:P-loop containing nucleoside triphosphate hydrolase protein [Mycena albidolilacea]|uniref:DNA 3'-5' helicase n=1 Tax=Mycena albidolilacea TaxID=1033008 RepID=A0AAD7EKL3_9AGAR|nr:P-loop containing nucleoside triphosphate hydrolase protein [Mycena albidolilacea]
MAPKPRKHRRPLKALCAPRVSAKITPEQLEAIKKELNLLPGLIRTNYTKWKDSAKAFQLQYWDSHRPHLLPSSKGKITLMVSPLLSLQDKQVSTFRNKFGLTATAINSSNSGCTKEVMEKVVSGEWQIVMLSPEMLLSRQLIDGVLCKPAFGYHCLSAFIDEAHCISHWRASFRKKYASIGIVQAFLPRTTPITVVTATLTPHIHQDLVAKLKFDPKHYTFCRVGNDQANVLQVICSMEHTQSPTRTYIAKAFLYTDDIKDGSQIINRLNSWVGPKYRDHVVVMALFKAGIIRVLVCTDAAGMGCDIPDIQLVVQWKAPKNLLSWIQRAGQAVRRPGTVGMAVMLVEKSAYKTSLLSSKNSGNTDTSVLVAPWGRRHGRGRGRGGHGGNEQRGGLKPGKGYTESHGLKCGWYRRAHNNIEALDDARVEVPQDVPAKGLYVLIQATIYRRIILTQIFKNSPLKTCCDICNPKLFDSACPGKPVKETRQQGIRRGPAVDSIRQELFSWQCAMKKQHYPYAVFAPHALLDDAICEILASIGPLEDIATLKQLLGTSWSHWDELRDSLFTLMRSLDIAPLPPPPPHAKKATAPTQKAPTAIPTAPCTPLAPQSPPRALGSVAPKRTHTTHSTPLDAAVLPAQHARIGIISETPPTPAVPHLR